MSFLSSLKDAYQKRLLILPVINYCLLPVIVSESGTRIPQLEFKNTFPNALKVSSSVRSFPVLYVITCDVIPVTARVSLCYTSPPLCFALNNNS